MNNDAYERAYRILELMADTDDIPDQLMERFVAWLISDTNREEKDAAMWRIFSGIMGEAEQHFTEPIEETTE